MQNVGQRLYDIASGEGSDQHAHSCSLMRTVAVRRYVYVFRDYVSGQRGPGSACANARADSGLPIRKLHRGLFVRCARYIVASY